MNGPDGGMSLEERLRREQRACPVCSYSIANPLTDRCPRCFSVIPRPDPGCGSCTHSGSCAFANEALQAQRDPG